MALAKGRLAEAYTCTGSCTSKITDLGFSYDERGSRKDTYESTPHSSGFYHLTAGYYANFALSTLSGLPGLPSLTYGVDGEGRYKTVSASTGQNPVTNTQYDLTNYKTTMTLGSADTDVINYDPNTGRVGQYTFNVNNQAVTGILGWNANGTLGSLTIADPYDSLNAQTCTYGHDGLARISSDSCTGSGWNQTFSFDPFGNINKSGTLSFLPTYNQATNRYQSLPGFAPTYDSNGNLLTDSFHTYVWSSENRPVTIDTVGLTYDALGRMVEQARGSSYTQIVYGPGGERLALMNAQTLTKAFVPLPLGDTAVYAASGLAYYRHGDWLGSSRFASTPSRGKYFDVAYAPYGEDYANSGTTDLSFTGQNQDTTTGMYDFLNREYHPVQGRWISPDPAGLAAVDMSNPQTWNRYGYVANMPLTSIDPLGLDPCTAKYSKSCPTGKDGGGAYACLFDEWCRSGGSYEFGILIYALTPTAVPIPFRYPGDHGPQEYTYVWDNIDLLFLLEAPSTKSDAANNGSGSWAWNFTKSFFTGFSLSTKNGTCLGVFADTVSAPMKQLRRTAQQYLPLITSTLQAGPSGAAMYMSQLNNIVASGAAEADPQVAAVVTTAGAAAATAAPYVSAAAPYIVPVGGDALLLNGVIKEVQSGMSGQCTW